MPVAARQFWQVHLRSKLGGDRQIYAERPAGLTMASLYYGCRDIEDYLADKPENSQHVLICTGLAFLHFINPSTTRLYVVDRNPEQVRLNKLIIELVVSSEDLKDFVAYLEGRHSPERAPDPECYRRTFLRPDVQRSLRIYETAVSGELRRGLYYWYVGDYWWSALSSAAAFAALQGSLRRIPIAYRCAYLEALNYAEFQSNEAATYVYVSNADMPTYTPADAIQRQICLTMLDGTRVYYRSWFKSLALRRGLHHEDAVEKLRTLTTGRDVTELATYLGNRFHETELNAKSICPLTLCQFMSAPPGNPGDILLYHLASVEFELNRAREFLGKASMQYRRIIVMDRADRLHGWLDAAEEAGLRSTYAISVDWSGGATGYDRNVILSFHMRGDRTSRCTGVVSSSRPCQSPSHRDTANTAAPPRRGLS
jgi:hypothetical protein